MKESKRASAGILTLAWSIEMMLTLWWIYWPCTVIDNHLVCHGLCNTACDWCYSRDSQMKCLPNGRIALCRQYRLSQKSLGRTFDSNIFLRLNHFSCNIHEYLCTKNIEFNVAVDEYKNGWKKRGKKTKILVGGGKRKISIHFSVKKEKPNWTTSALRLSFHKS